MRLIDKMRKVQEIGTEVALPFNSWRFFCGEKRSLELIGNDISLGGDYVSLKEAREAVHFIVHQLGGKIKWEEFK